MRPRQDSWLVWRAFFFFLVLWNLLLDALSVCVEMVSNYHKAVNRPGHHIPILKACSLSVVIYVFDLCTCGFVIFSEVIYVFHLWPCAFSTSISKSCALGTASLRGISQVPCHSLHKQFGNRIPLEEGLFMNLKGIFDIVRVAPPLTSFLLIHSLQLFWRLRTSAYEIRYISTWRRKASMFSHADPVRIQFYKAFRKFPIQALWHSLMEAIHNVFAGLFVFQPTWWRWRGTCKFCNGDNIMSTTKIKTDFSSTSCQNLQSRSLCFWNSSNSWDTGNDASWRRRCSKRQPIFRHAMSHQPLARGSSIPFFPSCLLAFLCLEKKLSEKLKVLWFTLLRSNKRFEHLLGFENSLTICTHACKHARLRACQP